jgi:nucleolar GTP-binding protein
MQFIDTPGLLDRPAEDRNPIERQAMTAMINLADVILCIVDASEHCGYPVEEQVRLLHEIEQIATVPVVVAANKSDLFYFDGYLNMSTETGEGISEVLDTLLAYREQSKE